MSNPTQDKPGGKSGPRNRKPAQPQNPKPAPQQAQKPAPLQARKPAPLLDPQPEPLQNGKPAQPQNPEPAPQQAQRPAPLLEPQPEPLQNGKPIEPAVASTEAFPVGAAASPNTVSIDFQTIATAYSDYSRKSFEQTRAFVEKLSSARSFDKVIEIQTEFAKQAYETFVTESQKIRELYSGLARQAFKPLESLLAKTIPAVR
jgi:Phasin protein